ncbi:MAG: hypothetical protein PHR81_03115 [Bacteroidales bacterium]|nr:hypothetical protein [Bacteroidales bacterium]MDD4213780.1 hypothetical protein [Bacteroidales bacterium]
MKFLEKEDSKPTAKHIDRSHLTTLKPKPATCLPIKGLVGGRQGACLYYQP